MLLALALLLCSCGQPAKHAARSVDFGPTPFLKLRPTIDPNTGLPFTPVPQQTVIDPALPAGASAPTIASILPGLWNCCSFRGAGGGSVATPAASVTTSLLLGAATVQFAAGNTYTAVSGSGTKSTGLYNLSQATVRDGVPQDGHILLIDSHGVSETDLITIHADQSDDGRTQLWRLTLQRDQGGATAGREWYRPR